MTTYVAPPPNFLKDRAGTDSSIIAGELALIDAKFKEYDASSVLGTLADGKILVGNGDNVAVDVTMSGDATLANTGAITIANEAVTLAKMADLARGSIITGQTANNRPTALDAKTSGRILVGDGTDLASVAVSGDATLAANGTLTIAAGAVEESMLIAQSADGLHAKRIARATYDFAADGGAVGSIGLGVTLPDNAVIVRSWYTVLTTFTSADDSATVAISIPTDDIAGIVAATAISAGGNVWDAGHHEGIQVGTAATFSEQTTAARELTLTVGVQDLTAGKLILFCEYVVLV
jgi:hypothetical protein